MLLYDTRRDPGTPPRTHSGSPTTVPDMVKLALAVGKEELQALKDGDVELAEACYARRAALMELALEERRPDDAAILREGLLAMQELQKALTIEGRELRAQLVSRLNRSKAEGRRMQGYRRAVAHAMA